MRILDSKIPIRVKHPRSATLLKTICFSRIYFHEKLSVLFRVLSIELWKTYLLYVKETKSSLSTYKEKMAQAYDFALDKMGLDIQSNALWNDYINFLKESPLL
jgi:hypothetical protein